MSEEDETTVLATPWDSTEKSITFSEEQDAKHMEHHLKNYSLTMNIVWEKEQ